MAEVHNNIGGTAGAGKTFNAPILGHLNCKIASPFVPKNEATDSTVPLKLEISTFGESTMQP